MGSTTQHQSSSMLTQQQCCRELAACGALRRSAFLGGLSQTLQQMRPCEAVQLINSLDGTFALGSLLQNLLPVPATAAQLIGAAACSQEVCLALIHHTCTPVAAAAAVTTGCHLQNVLQLLQALLRLVAFDPPVSSRDTTNGSGAAAAAATGFESPAADPRLQQYVTSVLQHLQDLAQEEQALATCLLQAAAACGVTCDADTVAGWVTQQLHRQLTAQLRKRRQTPSDTPPHDSSLTSNSSTTFAPLALQPLCWSLMLQPALQCMQLQDVLQILQDQLSTAAGSVTEMLHVCDVLAALGSAGQTAGAVQVVASSLAAAALAGRMPDSLASLLLGAHLLTAGCWGKEQYTSMLGQAVATCRDSQPASSLPVLFKAFTLLMPNAATQTLQVQVEVLQQLQPHLSPVLQPEASQAISLLKDVCLQRQQLQKQERLGRQGPRTITRAAYEGFNFYLNQYLQLSEDAQGRRLTHVHVAKWRLMDAPAFAEAWIQQPPDTPERALGCLKYIQELQAHRLCAADRADAFKTSCFALGINFPSQHGTAQHAAAQQEAAGAGGPLEALKSLLDRLPVVVASGSHSALPILLGRIGQHVQALLQPDADQQPPKQPGTHAAGAALPPAKRQCIHPAPTTASSAGAAVAKSAAAAAAAGDRSDTKLCEVVLELLLDAYGSTLSQQAGAQATQAAPGQPGASDWRVEFVRMLQQLPALHPTLLQLLLGSLSGGGCAAAEAPQEALRHGSLLAWLSASQLQQRPVLSSQAHAPITTAAAAMPLFRWSCFDRQHVNGPCSSTSTGAALEGASSAEIPCGQLAGLQLVQYLLGSTSLHTVLQRCCAASLWAAYVGCVKKCMPQWFADPAGPFASASTAGTSPGVLTAPQQTAADVPVAGQQQNGLLAYIPLQLAVLLRQLAAGLTADLQQAAAAAVDGVVAGGDDGAVSPETIQVALQVCTRALKAQPVKWVCQLYGV